MENKQELEYQVTLPNKDCEFMVLTCDKHGLQIKTNHARITMGYYDFQPLIENVENYKKMTQVINLKLEEK